MLSPKVAADLARGSQRIVLTGASGWLGSATLELLAEALGDGFAHRVRCYGSRERELVLRNGLRVPQAPLDALRQLDPQPTWLLHFAFLTKDRAEDMDEAAYRAATHAIGDMVMEAIGSIGVNSVFLASSGAAAKADDPAASEAMRLYGMLKREDEERFSAWAQGPARRLVIARIFSVTGPYINKHHAYAIASFILDGLAGRPIAVRAPRAVVRSYVAIRELMSLALALLGSRTDGIERFDSGGAPLELETVAQTVAQVCGCGAAVDRAPITDDHADSYHGDGDRYADLLARHGIAPVSLDAQIRECAAYLRAAAAPSPAGQAFVAG